MKLLDVGEDLRALQDLIDEGGGEIRPDDEMIVDSFMAEVSQNQSEKLGGMVALIKNLEGEIVAATATRDQLDKKIATRQRSVDWLKLRIKNYLDGTGQKKVLTTSGFAVSVVGNGGKKPMRLDEANVPPEFCKVIPEQIVPDKDAIRKALDEGQTLSFAELLERGSRLSIS